VRRVFDNAGEAIDYAEDLARRAGRLGAAVRPLTKPASRSIFFPAAH